jgi:autotransporter family porin
MHHKSAGVYHNPANGHVPNNIPITFTTTLGTIKSSVYLFNGIAKATLVGRTLNGVADVTAKLEGQTAHKSVPIGFIVLFSTPTNLQTGVSRTNNIYIKFSENIKTSTYFNNITIKNLTTGKTIKLSKTIKGNTLYIKTTKRTANTWYLVTIPKAAIKDNAGNNLLANYTFKFKTGK